MQVKTKLSSERNFFRILFGGGVLVGGKVKSVAYRKTFTCKWAQMSGTSVSSHGGHYGSHLPARTCTDWTNWFSRNLAIHWMALPPCLEGELGIPAQRPCTLCCSCKVEHLQTLWPISSLADPKLVCGDCSWLTLQQQTEPKERKSTGRPAHEAEVLQINSRSSQSSFYTGGGCSLKDTACWVITAIPAHPPSIPLPLSSCFKNLLAHFK